MPTTTEEWQLPVQQYDFTQYDVGKIMAAAKPEIAARLGQLIELEQYPFGKEHEVVVDVPVSPMCTPEHCTLRERAGIIRRVTPDMEREKPSVGWLRSFPVVESTSNLSKYPSGKRLRIIDAPFDQNEAIYARGYVPHLPELGHVSEKLGAVFHACGVTGDISSSFYGLQISRPETVRFRDSTGVLYEMLVSMMGSVVSVEKQQIITSVMAGHVDYAREPAPLPRPDVWVDNIRYTGTRNLVNRCSEYAQRSAEHMNIALNMEQPSTKYTFIGVDFNHERRTVRISEKTSTKFPKDLAREITAGEYESLIGRLIHCSAVRQEPLVNRWWVLKWSRRVLNKLNRGMLSTQEKISISDGVHHQLRDWIAHAGEWHEVVRSSKNGKSSTLYTDATLESWGAVYITDDGRVYATGAKFDDEQRVGDIGRKEGFAVVNALRCFSSPLNDISRLNLFVDNTSVGAGLRRGQVRAESLRQPVADAWREIIGKRIELFVDYVSTHVNPADAYSRGETLTVEAINNKHSEVGTKQQAKWKKGGGLFVL